MLCQFFLYWDFTRLFIIADMLTYHRGENLEPTKFGMAKFIVQQLGVPMVSSSFTFYRDAFLFALAVRWDIDVERFDLVIEQFTAAFGFVNVMQRARTPTRAIWAHPTGRSRDIRVPPGGCAAIVARRPCMRGCRSTTCRTNTP